MGLATLTPIKTHWIYKVTYVQEVQYTTASLTVNSLTSKWTLLLFFLPIENVCLSPLKENNLSIVPCP